MRRVAVLFICLVPLVAAVPQRGPRLESTDFGFVCPEEDGNYGDELQCDLFFKCQNGKAIEKLCDDGLVYDPRKAFHADPCDSRFVVDCGNRTELQPPTNSSIYCPRKNGIFPDPDPSICDAYINCNRGKEILYTCPPGLHFDIVTGNCAWPDAAARVGCGAKPKPSINGFVCPSEKIYDENENLVINPTYPDLDDCRKFYVCLNGENPQAASCDRGRVFNERTGLCDTIENVPECSYEPLVEDPDLASTA